MIFTLYSLLVTVSTYVGDPIDCVDNKGGVDGDYIDQFCYIHGTHSLKWPRKGKVHDTIGYVNETWDCKEGEEYCSIQTHDSYMWISMLVLIQAAIFYLPHYLWRSWEGGKMKQLLSNIIQKPKFFNDDELDSRTSSTTHTELKSSGV